MRDYINSLIGGITHEVKRMSLEISINNMEADLAALAKQRVNDEEAADTINGELVLARRKMQILVKPRSYELPKPVRPAPPMPECCNQNCQQGRSCPARKA